ncbi:hypothetical protein [Lewinella sp. IMCC34191]|uniref:hypothetical protein n=1 Tax=Lewinella sp. IMCC34191 TaxID=2259172 RepID=UPI000E24F6B7|nr:hypothetical protein [Lewinella sp. IMCC34191]
MPPLAIPSGESVRVVHGDPGNPMQVSVERALAEAGFTVFSSGLLGASMPASVLRYEAADTTVYRTDRAMVYQRLYEDQEVQYLLKYSYTGEVSTLTGFSASLVQAEDGRLVGSYSDTFMLGRNAARVMEDFTESLRRALSN